MTDSSSFFTRRRLLGLGALAALAAVASGPAQAYGPARVTRVSATLPGLRSSLRAAVLSDLHYGPLISAAQVRAWVNLTRSLSPDLILLPGDLCDVPLADGMPEPLLMELGRLQAPLGVFAAWGNHDYASFGRVATNHTGPRCADWRGQRAAFSAALRGVGVQALRNEGRELRPDLWLGGVDDLTCGDTDCGRALRDAPVGMAQLLMMHEPDGLMTLAAEDIWQPGGLAVCGHTHGGQIRFPGVGALKVPSEYGQRFAQGWVKGEPHGEIPGARGFVSRGLGVSGLPLRFLCPPEVVLLTLSGTGTADAEFR